MQPKPASGLWLPYPRSKGLKKHKVLLEANAEARLLQ
jgi:hypothetical protein